MKSTKPSAPHQPDRYFIGSTETTHAIVDCYEVIKGRIVLVWKSKYDDAVHEVSFWRPAHATPEVVKAIIMEKLHAIDEQAKTYGGGQGERIGGELPVLQVGSIPIASTNDASKENPS